MLKELTVQHAYLHAILTPLLKQNRQIELITPWLRQPTFNIVFADNKRFEISLPNSKKTVGLIGAVASREVAREIPGYGIIQELLIQSGINVYPNRNELLALLQKQAQEKPFQRPLFLSFDTNLLRDRFFTTQQSWVQNLALQRIGIVSSPYIPLELTFTRRKYRDGFLSKLASTATHDQFNESIFGFRNQNSLEDRRRRLGFLQTLGIQRMQWYAELPVLEDEELQESADANIILTLQRAVDERSIDILFLSRDQDVIAMAEGLTGIRPFLLKTPRHIHRSSTFQNQQQLAELIYCAAITFGVIELRSGSSALHLTGIWTGKSSQDWKSGRLRLKWRSKNKSVDIMRRSLAIIEAMNWPNQQVVI